MGAGGGVPRGEWRGGWGRVEASPAPGMEEGVVGAGGRVPRGEWRGGQGRVEANPAPGMEGGGAGAHLAGDAKRLPRREPHESRPRMAGRGRRRAALHGRGIPLPPPPFAAGLLPPDRPGAGRSWSQSLPSIRGAGLPGPDAKRNRRALTPGHPPGEAPLPSHSRGGTHLARAEAEVAEVERRGEEAAPLLAELRVENGNGRRSVSEGSPAPGMEGTTVEGDESRPLMEAEVGESCAGNGRAGSHLLSAAAPPEALERTRCRVALGRRRGRRGRRGRGGGGDGLHLRRGTPRVSPLQASPFHSRRGTPGA